MKVLFKAHIVTAILLWLFMLTGVLREGGPETFVCMTATTFITVIDISSVYLLKKEKAMVVLPAISMVFWSYLFLSYGIGLFLFDLSWQNIVFGFLTVVAFFKIVASVFLGNAMSIIAKKNRV